MASPACCSRSSVQSKSEVEGRRLLLAAAEQAARTGTPIYVESVGAQGVSLAVRPVRWGGQVAKIAVVAVPYRDRSALLPQIAQGGFERLAK